MIPAPPVGIPAATSRVYRNFTPNLCVFTIVRKS